MFFATGFTLLLAVGLFVGLFLLNYKFRMKFYSYLSRLAHTWGIGPKVICMINAFINSLGLQVVCLVIIYLGLPWIPGNILSILLDWVGPTLFSFGIVFFFFAQRRICNMVLKAVESPLRGGYLGRLVMLLDILFRASGFTLLGSYCVYRVVILLS